MRIACALFFAVAGSSMLLALRPMEADERPSAGAEIQRLLDAQVAAWNKGDLEGFMKGYWKSPDLSFFSGKDKRHGWDETMRRYRQRYQAGDQPMGQLTFSELQIDPLGDKSAWVRGRWKLLREKETLEGLFTLIVKQFPEGWRIVHDHTSG